MNSPANFPTKTERLELALRSRTLGDVAGILAEMSPGDVAYLISSSPPDYRAVLLGLLEPEQEVLVVNELPDELRNAALADREPEALAELVEQLDDDDVADILHELPDEVTGQVLAIMDVQYRQRLQKVLSFSDDVAGGLMSTDTITIRADLTLDVVLRYLRRHTELPPNTDTLIVVNRNDRFVGLLAIGTVLVSDPAVSVREMMITDQEAIAADTPATEVARRFERNDWISAPVIDDDGKLLGRITIDDVVDVIREEADHSLTSLAGLAEEDTFATVWQSAPRRAVWLGVNLGTALLASSVINLFQDTIEKVGRAGSADADCGLHGGYSGHTEPDDPDSRYGDGSNQSSQRVVAYRPRIAGGAPQWTALGRRDCCCRIAMVRRPDARRHYCLRHVDQFSHGGRDGRRSPYRAAQTAN